MPTNTELALQLFLQLAVVLAVCRALGAILRRYFGQTQVVGEMVAGLVLGPSVVGALSPASQSTLFPTILVLDAGNTSATVTHPSMTILFALSQVGVMLYMFIVGIRFNLGILGEHLTAAGTISLTGILVPTFAGGLLGWSLADDDRLFGAGVAGWQAALFLAAAMSITAFPVLARILHDLGLAQTRVGTLAIGAAALDDLVAWSLLAIVLASLERSGTVAALAIGGGVAYTVGMIVLGRPLLRRLDRQCYTGNQGALEHLALVLVVLVGGAWFTEVVGIHAVFGAFIAGAVMPRTAATEGIARLVEPVTLTALLPLFFVYSGLNTRLGLLSEASLIGIAILAIGVAFACKGGGCFLAARLGGVSWREAAMVGALMNARGLMELVLIGIALERGLITPALFTILAMMAILTTIVASPLFRALYQERPPVTALAPTPGGIAHSSS